TAPSFLLFLLARIAIGVGVATILPTIMGIITFFFPPESQGQATGAWAFVNSLGHAVGPSLGGLLLGFFSWQSIFWVNIPLAAAAIALALKVLPVDKPTTNLKTFDWLGAGAMTVLVFSAMIGLTQTTKLGIRSPQVILLWAAAIVSFGFILVYERRKNRPFVDLKLFKKRDYLSAIVPISLQAFTQFGLLVSLPIFLIDMHKIDDTLAGLIIMSMTLMMALTSPVAGRLIDRWTTREVCRIGTMLVGAGALLMFFMKVDELNTLTWVVFLLNLAVFGTGFGMIQSSSTVSAIQASSKENSGAATGFFHMIRFVSASLGSTVTGLLLESSGATATGTFYQSFLMIVILTALTIPFTFWMASNKKQLKETPSLEPYRPAGGSQ
ncbi:MAG: MFS transporter, partial [Anaerolineaceae bacterium]